MFHRGAVATAAVAAAAMAAAAAPAGFSVARALGSHMTLQRAPAAARVWGQDVPGATVRVILSPGDGAAHAGVADAASGVWRVALPPQEAGGPFTLTFNSSSGGSAVLEDVYFGLVFLCGGQSKRV